MLGLDDETAAEVGHRLEGRTRGRTVVAAINGPVPRWIDWCFDVRTEAIRAPHEDPVPPQGGAVDTAEGER